MAKSTGLYARYKGWVRRNNVLLNLLETGLSSLTWVLPDRFADGELTYEAIHTGIGLVSTLHESILSGSGEAEGGDLLLALGVLQQLQVLVELAATAAERASGRSRYDALLAYESVKAALRVYVLRRSRARMLLQGGLSNLEPQQLHAASAPGGATGRPAEVYDALLAFRTRHCAAGAVTGDGTRLTPVSSVLNQQQPAQQPSVESQAEPRMPEGDVDELELAWRERVGAPGGPAPLWWERCTGAGAGETCAGGSGGGTALVIGTPRVGATSGDAFDRTSKVERKLTARSPDKTAPPVQLDPATECVLAARQAAARLLYLGELLHLARPVVYTAALRRWGRSSWRPWALSLAADLGSAHLTWRAAAASAAAAGRAARDPSVAATSLAALVRMQGLRFSPAELEELRRRRVTLLYYLLRDPMFARSTRPALGRILRVLAPVPLAGAAAEKLVGLLDGVQALYSYTSAS